MKRHHRRSLPKPKPKPPVPVPSTVWLDVDVLLLLQASFTSLEDVLRREVTVPGWRLALAAETLRSVQRKIGALLGAPQQAVTFDANELLLIRAGVQVYAIDLLCQPSTPERSRRIQQCYEVASRLSELPDGDVQADHGATAGGESSAW